MHTRLGVCCAECKHLNNPGFAVRDTGKEITFAHNNNFVEKAPFSDVGIKTASGRYFYQERELNPGDEPFCGLRRYSIKGEKPTDQADLRRMCDFFDRGEKDAI